MAVIGLYVAWRYVARLALPRTSRWGLGLLVMGLILHYPIVSRFWGSMASPEVPRALLLVLGAGAIGVLILAIFLLLRDLAGGVVWLMSRRAGRGLLSNRVLAHALAASAFALSVIGTWQAVRVPSVHRIELTLPGLAPSFDGYRIAHLTDIHASRLLQGPWIDAVVRETNALDTDLIVISGDTVDGSPQARAADYPPLGRLAARDGVFAVSGNHEYYSGYLEWMSVFERLGFRMLVNTHAVVSRGGHALVVAGVPDQVAARHGLPAPDVAAALAGKPADAAVILLDHRPARAPENAGHDIDLQLSGHTHGGHAIGLDRLVARFNRGYVSGLYEVGSMQLFVGNGAGLWPGFAVRLGKSSQIVEITLRSSAR